MQACTHPSLGALPPYEPAASLLPLFVAVSGLTHLSAQDCLDSTPIASDEAEANSYMGPAPHQASALPFCSASHRSLRGTRNLIVVPQPQSFATIHALPVELLSRIFLFGFSDGIDPAQPFKRKAIEHELPFEVIISHVCPHWRNVAINLTPSLWTTLRLRKPSHIDKCNEFVRRSGRALVDVMMETVGRKQHEPGFTLGIDEFDVVFDFAHKNSLRMRTFLCKVSDLECKQQARERLHTLPAVPHLETLQLYHLQMWEDTANLVNQTTRAPILVVRYETQSLVNLSLVGVNLAWSLKLTPYLAGLKNLELALHAVNVRPNVEEWEDILRHCPDLERLTLHYSGPRMNGPWTIKPIPLLRLIEISFNDLDADVVCAIIRNSHMPAVRSLTLELAEQDATPFITLVSEKGSHDFPELRRLRITALDCEVDAWRAFLGTVPKLSELDLDLSSGALDVDLFNALSVKVDTASEPHPSAKDSGGPLSDPHAVAQSIPSPTHAIILPTLSTLRVAGIPGDALQRFLSFREEAGHPVASVLVHRKSRDKTIELLETTGKLVYYDLSDDEDDEEQDGEEWLGEEEGQDDGEGDEGDEAELSD